jgi:hypothetical protein
MSAFAMQPANAPSVSPTSHAPESTLIYGNDETGVSAFATGMALRHHRGFHWVDCARSAPVEDLPAHWIFARGSRKPEVGRIDLTILSLTVWTPAALRQLVTSEGPEEESRLLSFLCLPELFQRLGAPDRPGERESAILLANVDSLPPDAETQLLGERRLHECLHRAGISLFATARLSPSAAVSASFDRVYRIDVPDGVSWSHGLVSTEKDPNPLPRSKRPRSVRKIWRAWDLDPSLLPPL